MYKLFLCIRYLRSRVLAWAAVVCVTLCVAMMLIVVSVMNGFVGKIERAAKGLFGDVVIEASSLSGLAHYDELIDEIKREVPEVTAGSPFIISFGILRLPGQNFRQAVQVAGIRLPERADVTDFEEGLFVQKGYDQPSFDPPMELILQRLEDDLADIRAIRDREVTEDTLDQPEVARLADRIDTAVSFHLGSRTILEGAEFVEQSIRTLEEQLARLEREDPASELIGRIERELTDLSRQRFWPPENRVILGLGIPQFSFRTESGGRIRVMVPGQQIVLTLVPLGRHFSATEIAPVTETFSVVDDCRTDVSNIDSNIVYIRFEKLQAINQMAEEVDPDDPSKVLVPARCGQVHLKVRDDCGTGEALQEVRRKVDRVWSTFREKYPDAASASVNVLTWRQRQAQLVSSIEAQRTLMVIILGIISVVSIVLIFVIFYMIVYQKTRDIGVLKAVGASSGGIAGIFLTYGAAVGLVGSIVGTVVGWYFVLHINPIHDWVGRTFGFRVWSAETFLFEEIPNEVDSATAMVIVVGSVLSGVLGALVPAVRAARMEPVEALRYE